MGRTNATYRNHLDNFIDSFNPFKRALREENKEHLNQLWEKAHSYASAAAYMNSTDPGAPALISIMLGLQKDLENLESRVEKLENQCSK